MNTNELRRAGHISMGVAFVAAVVGALSLMSVTSTAYGGSDDRGSDDRGGRGSDDGPGDDRGGRNGGHGSDDGPGDDHGRRHGGHGADDGMQRASGSMLPLAEIASNWEARGYKILDISREGGSVVEIDVIDANGQRWEMYVDTANDAILRRHRED